MEPSTDNNRAEDPNSGPAEIPGKKSRPSRPDRQFPPGLILNPKLIQGQAQVKPEHTGITAKLP
jgi:hypothetical protein